MKLSLPVPIHVDRHGAEAITMVQRLQDAGHAAYLAGGCVRDLIMGRLPHDYDIATNASPTAILDLFPEAKAVGRAFPVVRITRRSQLVDIASFRKEGIYLDGRHPVETSPGTLEEDARRRDFTVNALYLDPITQTIVDEVNGMSDINHRRLRFVGKASERLAEDHLRLMRAVRFSCSLGLTLEQETFEAIQAHATLLERISTDRIRDEFLRCLTEAIQPSIAIQVLSTTGLLQVILREDTPSSDDITFIQNMFAAVETRIPELMIAIVLHQHVHRHRGEKDDGLRDTLERLRFSNEFIQAVQGICSLRHEISTVTTSDSARIRRIIAHEHFTLGVEYFRIEHLVAGISCAILNQLTTMRNRIAQPDWLPTPWISGDDLKALGIPLGPELARWKRWAHDQQLGGHYPDRHALFQQVTSAIRSQSQ